MERLYLLNNHVYFDTAAGMLSSSLCFTQKIPLSKPASHCLRLLIAQQGKICDYPFISHQIWGERGKWTNHNTIHQHIYQLRTRLSKAGINKEAIITIPRMGFQLCPQVVVEPVKTEDSPHSSEKIKSKRTLWERLPNLRHTLYVLIILNLMMTFVLTVRFFL